MPDSPVENRQPPDYPHEMETRVAILEHTTAELKFDIREVKAMVRDLTNTILAKFDATDKAIADLRVDNQTLRTELQTGLYSNLRWTVGTILGFGTLGIAIVGLLIKFH
jgi:pyruvate/oxaloacetate carboxyltransferase